MTFVLYEIRFLEIPQMVRGTFLIGTVILLLMTHQTAWGAPFSHPSPWPLWNQFKEHFLQKDGRVIDRTDHDRSTSEGEAYTLFFSLVADDPTTFRKVLKWSRNNLAHGDLSHHLPAWLWGKHPDGTWGILDSNSASDADSWIAYSLIEAGKIWHEPAYEVEGYHLLGLIEQKEIKVLPGFGWALLPAPRGFQFKDGSARLNPSYFPLQILSFYAESSPHFPAWGYIRKSYLAHLPEIFLGRFSPDWFFVMQNGRIKEDPITGPLGSFDAIRVYLWAGLLSVNDPARKRLLNHLSGMALYLSHHSHPPLYVDLLANWATGVGPPGFSAALLPYLVALDRKNELKTLEHSLLSWRNIDGLYGSPPQYYDQVLALFGEGFLEHRFSFDIHGHLILPWTGSIPQRT